MKALRINIEDLPNGRNPILTYCRKLIKDGVNPKSKLHCFRENQSDPDVVVNNIEEASGLCVAEGVRGPPRFVKFKNWYPSSL